MSSFSFDKTAQGQFNLVGELTRHSLAGVKTWHFKDIFCGEWLEINLSKLCGVDTAGLAWLLLIVEHCRGHNIQVTFSHLPQDLINLAKLSAVDNLLTAEPN